MLKATTVKRKEDLVKKQRRVREREMKIYVLVSRGGKDVDDGVGVVIGIMCVREEKSMKMNRKKREKRFSI